MQFLKNKLDDTKIDFVAMRRIAGVISMLMVLGAWAAFLGIGPNWGIDFEGGTEIEIQFTEDVEIASVRGVLTDLGIPGDSVQQIGTDDENSFSIRIKEAGFGMDRAQAEVEKALQATFGDDWIESIDASVEVGARLSIMYKPNANGDRVPMAKVAEALEGLDNVGVNEGREEYEVVVLLPGLSQQVQGEVQQAFGGKEKVDVLSIQSIGPKVGGDLARQGAISVMATLGLVLLYVAFRFDLAFAPGAILALFHDVSITVGIFVLLQREFNLPMIGALLTIVGYSLNDTIVIYDRIRENMDRYRRTEMADLINVSINETLARTLATSLTTMLAIAAFLFLGGDVINNFALAMLCGIVFGTYSTVFVASPMILVMEDLKPWLQRFVVTSGDGGEGSEAMVDESQLTESEKRRRERERLESDSDDASRPRL